jgi:methionyl-tRNA formyltransferase
MKIACIGYRDWALNIYYKLAQTLDSTFLIIKEKEEVQKEVLKDFQPDLVLFYGWSWYVPDEIIEQYKCLMLHPSPLPKYRGGSPIQNQIIAGEKDSMVTIFVMTQEMDAGDIVGQEYLSLEGSLSEIFDRIEKIGYKLTVDILTEGINPVPQDEARATYCTRRKPRESEITVDELTNKNAEYLYNKIRMLADPYPNAYIRTADGKKLKIKDVEVENEN